MKIKLKNPSNLITFYPLINSSLILQGEPKQFMPAEDLIDVMLVKNGLALIRIPAMGFAYIWERELY